MIRYAMFIGVILWACASQASNIVIKVDYKDCSGRSCIVSSGYGTAVAIGRKGGRLYWVTAQHLFESPKKGESVSGVYIKGKNGWIRSVRDGGRRDNNFDIAAVHTADYPAIDTRKIAPVPKEGSRVTMIGYNKSGWKTITGTISKQANKIEIDADKPISNGMSGGGIYHDGYLIGVINGYYNHKGVEVFGTAVYPFRKYFPHETCDRRGVPFKYQPVRPPSVVLKPTPDPVSTPQARCDCKGKWLAIEQQIRSIVHVQQIHRQDINRNASHEARIAKLEELAAQLQRHMQSDSKPDAYTKSQLVKLATELDKLKELKAIPGPRGPKGEPGRDGLDGLDGKPGKDLILTPRQVETIVSRMLKVQVEVENSQHRRGK